MEHSATILQNGEVAWEWSIASAIDYRELIRGPCLPMGHSTITLYHGVGQNLN